MRLAQAPRADPIVVLTELRVELAALVRRVEALEAVRPRDAADAALRQLLPEQTRALPFRSRELLLHAVEDPVLATALADASLQGEREIGCWLRAQRGTRENVTITRHGKQWTATWATWAT